MRCTSTPCRHRFKGFEGDKCTLCGKNATVNAEYVARPWRKNMCTCTGMAWGDRGSPHRYGSGDCDFNPRKYQHDPDQQT